ncbi:hypothetical protein H4R20_000835 [Coemansia guatemalensis]|uniref:Uncharacterized protein n=1 Tax=Coemansia guatemalensis TaxID=2761395 RepID=A0A9W8I703_9FUNG|nr:hypothetical protein H4R20_000835 [Coemansia guatemalensis]
MVSMDKGKTQPEQSGGAASADNKAEDAQTSINKQFDAQIAAMQDMLKDLTAKVEVAERDAQDKVGQTDGIDGLSRQQQQTQPPQVSQGSVSSVSDALRDMTAVEKAVGDYETHLDHFLSRLDAMLDGDKQHIGAPPADKNTCATEMVDCDVKERRP